MLRTVDGAMPSVVGACQCQSACTQTHTQMINVETKTAHHEHVDDGRVGQCKPDEDITDG